MTGKDVSDFRVSVYVVRDRRKLAENGSFSGSEDGITLKRSGHNLL
jgi:hypothetical protein